MSSGSGVCECWRLTPEGVHGSRACLFYGMHWSEVAAAQESADRTNRGLPVDPEWDAMTDDRRQAYCDAVVSEIRADRTPGASEEGTR